MLDCAKAERSFPADRRSGLLPRLDRQGRLKLDEVYSDGKFAYPKKGGGEAIGLTKSMKGAKIMLLVDGHGTPLSVLAASASLGETSLLEPLLDQSLSPSEPARLIYDRSLRSDVLRERLRQRGVELVYPHGQHRIRAKLQDGLALRRFTRCWKIERTQPQTSERRLWFAGRSRSVGGRSAN